MPLNVMKSETLEEAQARLREQTQLEREGFEAVTEGQTHTLLQPSFVGEENDDVVQAMHERIDAERIAPSMQDRPDEGSVEWTKRALTNAPDAQVHGEDAKPRASRRGGRKSTKKSNGE